MILVPGMLTELLPPGKFGSAEIVHDAPDMLTRLRAARDGQSLRAGKYTRLLIGGSLWMTDAEFECATNRPIIKFARGHVLIAGLGLGLILRPILAKRSVKSVTVLELNADVIELVGKHYRTSRKLTIIEADAFTYCPTQMFDAIYFDIFRNVPNSDDRPAINRLKRRYGKHLNPGGWMGAWCERLAR